MASMPSRSRQKVVARLFEAVKKGQISRHAIKGNLTVVLRGTYLAVLKGSPFSSKGVGLHLVTIRA